MNSVRERSILAVPIAKFGQLREPIRNANVIFAFQSATQNNWHSPFKRTLEASTEEGACLIQV